MLDAEWLSELQMHCRDEATFDRILQLLGLDRDACPSGTHEIAVQDHTARVAEREQAALSHHDAALSHWGDSRIFVRALERIRYSLDPDDIVHNAACEAREYLDLDRVLVLRLESELCGQFVTESKREAHWENVVSENASAADLTLDFTTAADHLPIAVEPEQHPHLEAVSLAYLAPFEIQAIALAPILCQEMTWGILIAARRDEREFGPRSHEILQQFGLTAGNALDHAELLEQTRAQARKIATTLRALQQTQTQLIQNEKMAGLGQLVAGIAHELNNPVNFIYGNISYIRDYSEDLLDTIAAYQQEFSGDLDPLEEQLNDLEFDFIRQDLPRLVTSMHNGITRIRKIVSSLRTFSRLDEAELKTVDIHSGIDSVLLLLKHRCRATERREEVSIELDYGDLPLISCYPASLNQVFVNLLANAFDALEQTTEQRPTISITTKTLDRDTISIAVRDNGCGISPEHQAHIFDPFFTTKPPGRGTGLGLSVSYQIVVENHEGQLSCESEPNCGTTLLLELPVYCQN